MSIEALVCGAEDCRKAFVRPGTRGPRPRFCSAACRARATRTDERREYERAYRRQEQAKGRKAEYEAEYRRRPEVRERARMRWHNDYEYRRACLDRTNRRHRLPEVRAQINARRRERYSSDPEYRQRVIDAAGRHGGRAHRLDGVVVPAPYSGHRWLDAAKAAVAPNLDHSSVWADQYHDDMGEALLAILEGRDPKQAVKEYRRREFISRHMTFHDADFRDEDGNSLFEASLPTQPSAENEVIGVA